MRTRLSTALLLLVATATATPASAQYFGRNKVQYKQLDFKVLKTEHFDIYYYPSAREGIDMAARMAERWHARLSRLFDHELRGRQPLVLYAAHPDFEQTNVIGGDIGEATGGVTEPVRRRIILPLGGPLADTDHVIGHELVHAFQFDITTTPGMAAGETGAARLPLWFIEGMAEYFSLGAVDPNTAMWMRDAARKDELPSIDDLDNPKYFPYRWGQAFWAYVAGRFGDDVVRQMLAAGTGSEGVKTAIESVLGMTTKTLSADWHSAIKSMYAPVLASTTPPAEIGTALVTRKKLGSDLNVGPAISPDGRWLAFLSEKSLFSIELYVADLQNQRIAHKLTSTATNPHYSSLQFIYSSGAWDPDSRRLAVATVTAGRPALAIFDALAGTRVKEVPLPALDEIFSPTWAPDGRSICVAGMSRGLTDLFVIDVDSGAVRPLTTDAYADLQPSWSPDGRTIAFVTDRFTSQLPTLNIGRYQIGLLDVATGRIEPRGGTPAGNALNPQWDKDGRTLYFVGNANGIANLYRLAPGSEAVALTNVQTGLSGITATSPSLSIATGAGLAVFSVYDEGRYEIYSKPVAPDSAVAQRVPDRDATSQADRLPPAERLPSDVQALLADAQFGLPAPMPYESVDYRPRLQLEGIGQPTFAIGADRYGAAIGGGISFAFGDMLGNHMLLAGVQINQGISGSFSGRDTAAQAVYVNQTKRWMWGVLGGQTPYLSGGASEAIGIVNGEVSAIDQTVLFRQTERSAGGLLAYPFSRARRLEFQASATQISFDQTVRTQIVSLETGTVFLDDTKRQSIGDSLTLGTASAAMVFDTASYGATSPVQGERYRLEVAPTFGAISNTSLLADYRRYVMPFPLYTLAGRVLHYGRYGSGGEDPRLNPLSIGYPSLVRGYDVYSIGLDECRPTAASACPAFDQLIGSRMLVGNLEFRFPLLRPFMAPSSRVYGPLPVEVALFLDGGVAWNSHEKPAFLGGSRDGVSSAGVTLRANLLGAAIAQFDFSRPFQRPGQGWVFQFNLAPGF